MANPGWLRDRVPMLEWLSRYHGAWLYRDLVAGVTVWAVMVPTALAYTGIAGVHPIVGLYTVPLALLAYAVSGTSRSLVVGPDSATAFLSAHTIGALVSRAPPTTWRSLPRWPWRWARSSWSSVCSAWAGWRTSSPSR